MRAGNLRHVITIQEKTLTSDGMGGNTEAWATFAIVRAAIWPVSAKERVSNQQLEHEITHKIRVRYFSGVTAAMRVVFDSRTFEILSIVNWEERNITLDLICEEVS